MIDLHTHSTASDGFLSPSELLHAAEKIGLEALALTDHDAVSGLDELHAAAAIISICRIWSWNSCTPPPTLPLPTPPPLFLLPLRFPLSPTTPNWKNTSDPPPYAPYSLPFSPLPALHRPLRQLIVPVPPALSAPHRPFLFPAAKKMPPRLIFPRPHPT